MACALIASMKNELNVIILTFKEQMFIFPLPADFRVLSKLEESENTREREKKNEVCFDLQNSQLKR